MSNGICLFMINACLGQPAGCMGRGTSPLARLDALNEVNCMIQIPRNRHQATPHDCQWFVSALQSSIPCFDQSVMHSFIEALVLWRSCSGLVRHVCLCRGKIPIELTIKLHVWSRIPLDPIDKTYYRFYDSAGSHVNNFAQIFGHLRSHKIT